MVLVSIVSIRTSSGSLKIELFFHSKIHEVTQQVISPPSSALPLSLSDCAKHTQKHSPMDWSTRLSCQNSKQTKTMFKFLTKTSKKLIELWLLTKSNRKKKTIEVSEVHLEDIKADKRSNISHTVRRFCYKVYENSRLNEFETKQYKTTKNCPFWRQGH